MALLSRWQGTDPPLRPLLPPLLPFGARLPSYTTKATGNRPEASGPAGAGWSGSSPSQGTSLQNRVPHKPVITAITLITAPSRALATGRVGCSPPRHCLQTATGAQWGDRMSLPPGEGGAFRAAEGWPGRPGGPAWPWPRARSPRTQPRSRCAFAGGVGK